MAAAAEIPFWVGRSARPKWVSGITGSTTCQDILLSLASSTSELVPEDVGTKRLILTEKWRDVERPLASEANILKIWTAWGEEKKFVKFVVKRTKNYHRKISRLRRNGSVSSVDEIHPRALSRNELVVDKNDPDQEKIIEDMMKIIEIQRKVISDELAKAKKKAKKAKNEAMKLEETNKEEINNPVDVNEQKLILDELLKLAQLNDQLQFAEESVDRLEIAIKQSSPNLSVDVGLISNHAECAKLEVSRLRSANDQAALEVTDNQKSLDSLDELKIMKRQILKRLEYDVNVIEKEGRKLAKEYEKVMNIKIDESILDDESDESDIYTELSLLNLSKNEEENSTSSGNSSYTSTDLDDNPKTSTTSTLTKDSPIDVKSVNLLHHQDENNSDTGLSSLHTSSDEGVYEVGTLV
jgi:hypothetical protein